MEDYLAELTHKNGWNYSNMELISHTVGKIHYGSHSQIPSSSQGVMQWGHNSPHSISYTDGILWMFPWSQGAFVFLPWCKIQHVQSATHSCMCSIALFHVVGSNLERGMGSCPSPGTWNAHPHPPTLLEPSYPSWALLFYLFPSLVPFLHWTYHFQHVLGQHANTSAAFHAVFSNS